MGRLFLAMALLGWQPTNPEPGEIRGQLRLRDGRPVPGALVTLGDMDVKAVLDAAGRFALHQIPPGSYRLRFTLGSYLEEVPDVVVSPDGVTEVSRTVDWELVVIETVMVRSASRRPERLVDAPAAMTAIDDVRIRSQASTGFVPKLLEFTPGVELAQGDIGLFNLNTRGFNNTLTRRLAVFVDGRSTAGTFLGNQAWPSMTHPMQDYESLELVRGPSAALYGANASSGVLNLTTRSPRDSLGLDLRITAGELGTFDTDVRYAAGLGSGWYLKVFGLSRYSRLFAVSRHEEVEYSVPCAPGQRTDCLPLDSFTLPPDNTISELAGGARLDKYMGEDRRLTLDAALHRGTCCGVSVTGVGRFLVRGDRERGWARLSLDWDRFNLLAFINDSGTPLTGAGEAGRLDEQKAHIEGQGRWDFHEGDWQMVAGGFYERDDVDGFDAPPIDAHREAVYGQAGFRFLDDWKLVLAARVEDGTVHEPQFSPRIALIWHPGSGQTIRFTYSQAFQAPSLNEAFLRLDAAAPVDLADLERLCRSQGVSCALGTTPVLAVGNPHLNVEQVRSIEVGYGAVLGGKTHLTFDAYSSENQDFITNLLPQVGTPFGRLNPDFGAWQGPADAESRRLDPSLCPASGFGETVADCVRALAPQLSNDADGSAVLVALSHTNFGRVDSRGIELGVSHFLTGKFRLDGAANWFDFDIREPAPGFPDLLLPNTPEWQVSMGLQYRAAPWLVGLRARWSDAFRWSAGVFVGDVPSYSTVDLDASYQVAKNWAVGTSLSNLLDDEHYEFFGGSVLGRRALAFVTFTRPPN
jgi:outer membrane receptor protein involved in Fe transport